MVQGMLRDHCWREEKHRVKDESALPPITNTTLAVELSADDRRFYRQAERLVLGTLRGMIGKHHSLRPSQGCQLFLDDLITQCVEVLELS